VIRHWYAFCRNLLSKERVEQELEEELRSYVDLVAHEKARSGADREEAWREARQDLGGFEQVKESVRDIRPGVFMDTLIQDLRYAIRILTKNPGFSVVAILTLALGIGANTTIFTVVNSVLLEPLPYPQPQRILMLRERQLSDGTLGTVAPANFVDWRDQSHSFSKMAALDPYADFILSSYGEPKRLTGAAVSADFFSLFGVQMALGRDFLRKEDRPGQNQVMILSNLTWRQHFGGHPDIVGKQVALNNASYTVVGVLPRGFSLVSKASDFQSRNRFDVWTPLGLSSPVPAWQRGTHPLTVFGRLKPGVSPKQARADLDHVASNLQRLYPDDDKERGITAVPLQQHVVAHVRAALFTLFGAVFLLLLLACANIANLLLTRAATRQPEISLRVALGASRQRLAQQLLTESLVLALLGGVLGASIASVAIPVLVHYLPTDLPRTAEVAVDGRVLAFTTLLSLITGVVFGLVPWFQAQRTSANGSLKTAGRGIVSGSSHLRNGLIVGQVAVALILLIGAGLMTKSLWTLLRVSPGFQTEHILTARLSLPPQYLNGYNFGTGEHRRISAFQRELLARVRNIPGVQSAAFAAYLPFSGTDNDWAFDIEGRPAKPAGVYDLMKYRPVSADYFKTMGIPVLRGRTFDVRDNEDGPLVVIINDAMARTFWPQQNPIGQRVRFSESKWRTVAGIVANVHHESLGSKPESALYVPYSQVPNVEARPTIILRTAAEPTSLTAALRRAVSEVDPTVPLDQIATIKQMVSRSVGQPRFRTAVLLTFALLALFVASIGLYGIMNYVVTQRIREFGIRMALGASKGAVLRQVLGQAVKLVSLGMCFGWLGAILLARWIASLLYGVTPFDVTTFASVTVVLAVVALWASFIPAHRAANSDPMSSLRYE
jgi:putative ABC transport system permease protein